MPQPTTIRDVASLAGVSISTVSRVLGAAARGRNIPGETRQRVEAAAAQLGWKPNPELSRRVVKRSGNIALVYGQAYPYTQGLYYNLLVILGQELARMGCRLMLAPVSGTIDEWLALQRTQSVDGLIVMPPVTATVVELIQRSAIPVVAINAPGELPCDRVLIDDAQLVGLALDEAVARGHRRVLITGLQGNQGHEPAAALADRSRAFLAEQPDWQVRIAAATKIARERHLHLTTLVAEPGAIIERLRQPDPPTVILTHGDLDAMVLLHALRAAGIPVPGQVSLISGCDEPTLPWTIPATATMDLPIGWLARSAIAAIDARLRGERSEQVTERLPVTCTVRGSLGLAPP